MKKVSAFIMLGMLLIASRTHGGDLAISRSHDLTRIVSLKPNITEILFALGAGDDVVGVTTWCDHPETAKNLPKVADYININTEKILALKPDIVIGSQENSVKGQFAALNRAGIKTMTLPFRTLEEMYDSIGKMAEEVGKKKEGSKLVRKIKNFIPAKAGIPCVHGIPASAGMTNASPNLTTCRPADTRTVLLLVGHRPLVAAGEKTFIGELASMAGLKNVVTGERSYPAINTEFLLAKDPDVIIDLGMGSETGGSLPAALRDRVVKMDIADFRAGPRVGEAVRKLQNIR